MILKTKSISKIINRVEILKDISLEIENSKISGLIGPNGAGKTSFFSILTGLSKPTNGLVTLDDVEINQLNFEQRSDLGIIYLPQEPSVFRDLSVSQNILAALEARKTDKNEKEIIMKNIISEFSLNDIKSKLCNSLSGGQRRRVEIARAIALKPKLILLDEPFAGIDPLVIGEIKILIKGLKAKGIGVLISDHNVNATLDICDHIYVINSGELVAEGNSEKIKQNPVVKKVYLGEEFTDI
tara:strand:+ start:4022 stop:4744 length:723 start_codon:yes stop_codon:yes gene_type:complete